ncbi:SusC/RagA family TonB-linked outer membrane protein [Epilithonimonas lactis]|uniref:TonB-dependent receptor n=1 Tax=Epilithonimonas lactis TaxID=421072 RepID=A0A085B9G8_9FLAO|nr:SusC/RagA family TonB-linked outer membrane protein [Epilithonimonas lactis]KFC19113.1 TonB-dependent receptor [Epilithonimonas lactis]SEQ92482.1 TonB-linked outer membrane protein, SusC/RagA family [Epilithonimonas lactis]
MKNSYSNIGGIFFGLMLTAVSSNTNAQTRTISGTVTSSNKPLSGVMISQEGSDQVTTTSENGTYTLQVSVENPILLFRHPDYSEERITATNQKVINISLKENVKGIEEVILNAGYYKVRDKESTGSIAKVSAKDIENQPVTNVLSAVQGRMPGVSITQNSGVAGGGYDIQIRGRNSLRNSVNSSVDGNQPLYVIDGVPLGGQLNSAYSVTIMPLRSISPLNAISPNDIESIEILKDADATAIYGSRGANGVVLITTKKGKKGTLGLSLNTSYSLSSVASHMDMMSTEQYLSMRRQAYQNAGIATLPATAYDVNGTWDQNRYTDWQKELIGRKAAGSMTQASISGGTDRNSFLVSFTHNDQSSVFPADYHYKTNILNSSFSHVSSDQKFRIEASNMFSSLSNNVVNSDLTTQALGMSPNAPALYDSAGNINWENNTFTNPVASLVSTYENKISQWNTNVNLSYRFWKDLSFKINGGINYQNLDELSLKPSNMYNPAYGIKPASSSVLKSNNSLFSYIIEPQLSWKKNIGLHQLDVLAGGSFQETNGRQSSMIGVGFASNALITNIGAATTKIVADQVNAPYKYAALYTRLNYQYNNRYIVNLTGRRDASSRFGTNNRVANFGAAGAAWLFTKESFFENISWLSYGKLRGSYGITGSDFIGDYQYLDTYTINDIGYNSITGLYPSRLYNPDYSWEKTKKLEAALELGLFKDRLMLTTSWYRNRSSDQLVGIPLPSTTGFSNVLANLGATVENSGWEMSLNSNIVRSEQWKWESGVNLTVPQNKLLSFPGLEGSTYANTYKVGYPTSIVKVFEYQGIDPVTGNYTFRDFNGDGKISAPDDTQAVENIGVRYFGGWQNQVSYKNISLSFLFYFVKQRNWNYTRNMPTPGTMSNLPAEFVNVWSVENPGGIIMPYSTGTNTQVNTLTNNFRNSTAAIGDASFIRLKNVQLNYRIESSDRFFKDAVVYVQGQNLWTWTKYFGLDPEFSVTGYLPPLKTIAFGLQLNF